MFMQHTIATKDHATSELTHAGVFTYPLDFNDKKVKQLVAEKLNRSADAVFILNSTPVVVR
ncbi:hypothetical protein [Stenotrophomonas phage BUCT609]|uniref:Uncharacterized protein n=1 Tax=Stenotrophomonas phage BUCT609 TaxID=2834250 RepID=A0A8E6URT7_9CAUD|nr:hypothetical protein [Stenotrophomonas phage BUCT609]